MKKQLWLSVVALLVGLVALIVIGCAAEAIQAPLLKVGEVYAVQWPTGKDVVVIDQVLKDGHAICHTQNTPVRFVCNFNVSPYWTEYANLPTMTENPHEHASR